MSETTSRYICIQGGECGGCTSGCSGPLGDLEPLFYGPMDPVHPCRQLETRHCPASYEGVCGERPCARYESDDETPWLPEMGRELGAVRVVPHA